jgi:hypothetical protein
VADGCRRIGVKPVGLTIALALITLSASGFVMRRQRKPVDSLDVPSAATTGLQAHGMRLVFAAFLVTLAGGLETDIWAALNELCAATAAARAACSADRKGHLSDYAMRIRTYGSPRHFVCAGHQSSAEIADQRLAVFPDRHEDRDLHRLVLMTMRAARHCRHDDVEA